MATSSRRAGTVRLRTAVDAYRIEQKDKLDKPALKLLDRLAGSPNAAKAFEGLKLKDQQTAARILKVCIEAEETARTFPSRLTEAKYVLARLKRLDKAAAELRVFVTEKTIPLPSGTLLLSSLFFFPGGNNVVEQVTVGLDSFAQVIEFIRRFHNETPERLGATRKTKLEGAPIDAGIWWLAHRVNATLGKPHREEVAKLAKVTLGTDVDIDRVDRIVRVRRKRRRSVEK